MDGSDDGWGKGSCMYRWPCWLIRYGWGVKKVGGFLDEVSFPGDGEEGGRVLFLRAVTSFLSNVEELGVSGMVLIGGVGSVRDGVLFSCDVGGAGRLTGWLSHVSGVGVILAIGVMTETGMLESMFTFRAVDIGLG